MKILEDIKVIELSSVLAGPQVGTFLAEMGAEVIKIENKITDGDVTRTWRSAKEDQKANTSAYFSSANWGKEHLFFDLSDHKEYYTVLDLINSADILLHNFKHGDDKKLKLDYESLKKDNPELIYAVIEGFESDPERVAYDVVIQAETGYMFMNGHPESGPTKMPLAFMDILAAHQLRSGILAALIRRSKTGKGCKVTCSLERSGIASLANQASNYLMADMIPKRMGSLHPNIAPYGETFTTADNKSIVLAIGSDAQFTKFCEIIERPELAEDVRFTENTLRITHRQELEEELADAIQHFDRKTLMDACIDQKVPVAAIRDMKEVFENPIAQDQILKEKQEGVETLRVGTVAFRISD